MCEMSEAKQLGGKEDRVHRAMRLRGARLSEVILRGPYSKLCAMGPEYLANATDICSVSTVKSCHEG